KKAEEGLTGVDQAGKEKELKEELKKLEEEQIKLKEDAAKEEQKVTDKVEAKRDAMKQSLEAELGVAENFYNTVEQAENARHQREMNNIATETDAIRQKIALYSNMGDQTSSQAEGSSSNIDTGSVPTPDISSPIKNESEKAPELQLQQPHVVRLETRPPNIEGKGEVTQYDLLINSLRMRPDRIILGEVRGREALDMLQAMNTGHDGSMCTIHANSPRDALTRLETMVAMGGYDLPQSAVRRQICSALDVVIQLQRLSDGSRKMTYFTEVTGMEGEVVSMQDVFRFDRKGLDEDGKALGAHIATGVQPQFLDRLRQAGVNLPPDIFMP
ncbi:MAG: ATPase, T2SS/T4P/T4SS family, partial [Candidatus Brocadiia bacterium]